jgi:hypothetical protein
MEGVPARNIRNVSESFISGRRVADRGRSKCPAAANLRARKRLPPRHRIAPARMLQRRPTPSARRAPHLPAQHVRRRVRAPPDHERHKRDSHRVIAGVAAQPPPVWLMQQLAQRRHRWRRWPRPCWCQVIVGITSSSVSHSRSALSGPPRPHCEALDDFLDLLTRPFWQRSAVPEVARNSPPCAAPHQW